MHLREKSILFSHKLTGQYLCSLNKKNSLLAGALAGVLARGRLFLTGPNIATEASRHPALSMTNLPLASDLASLSPDDFYFVQTDSAEILLAISRTTQAQVVLISDTLQMPEYLYDYHLKTDGFGPFLVSLLDSIHELQTICPAFQTTLHSRPALFLDRDGVIIKHIDHLSNPALVELNTGITEIIKAAQTAGYLIVVVTNQSGIGRQYFTREDYDRVNHKMLELLADHCAYVDEIFFSPYYEGSNQTFGVFKKNLRKPRPGMLLAASRFLNADLGRSMILGDRATDLIAGALAGVHSAFLINPRNDSDELATYKKWESSIAKKIQTRVLAVASLEEIPLTSFKNNY